MTDSNPCPAWCASPYPPGDAAHVHAGPYVMVQAGRAKSELARLELPPVYIRPILLTSDRDPSVLVFTASPAGVAAVSLADAAGLAAVIDVLAAATPAQHREVAAAIRQAAATARGEVNADG